MSEVELSFVMPAYNEGDSIEGVLDTLDRVVKDTRLRYEVAVVDDGSIDSTRVKAIEYANGNEHVRVIGYDRNAGKGYASELPHLKGVASTSSWLRAGSHSAPNKGI